MYGYDKLNIKQLKKNLIRGLLATLLLLLSACDKEPWNSPQPLINYSKNIRFGSFAESPKTLDPAQSYSMDETLFVTQIYEPVLQYHYLKRPFELVPLTGQDMPVLRYWNTRGEQVTSESKDIAFSSYDIKIKPHIYYQPHPAFAKDKQGQFLFLQLKPRQIRRLQELSALDFSASRELTAEDYVYQIKRLAHPAVNSPILGLMTEHIVGLKDYVKTLQGAYSQYQNQRGNDKTFFDLRKYPLAGATVIDKYTYRVMLIGQYPQFSYWLATWFFTPIPWEADYFYTHLQPYNRMLGFSWYPVGTGAYMLTENNPNKQMVLTRNPNFHAEFYPSEGTVNDQMSGYLQDAGKRLPMVDKFVFSLETEAIPRWNKFMQGYYDQSVIASDNFNEVIEVDKQGNLSLTPQMQKKQLRLNADIEPSIYYYGFNMEDPVVGGYSEAARKLRQAISIAINIEDFIQIFLNGRGIAAQGPLPPTIFGYRSDVEGRNPFVYESNGKRKSLEKAKALLAEAGYPGGRNIKTGKPLIIRYDTPSTSPSDKDLYDWMTKQLGQLGIELTIEATDYNRFQRKLQQGDVQFYNMGWVADYPDPENFLFLFYGKNAARSGGVNYSNYNNPVYDKLFEQMKNMPNNASRLALIQRMITILQTDNVWVWGMFPKTYSLSQSWLLPAKPNPMAQNLLKYQRILPAQRFFLIKEWNQPQFWPLIILVIVLLMALLPAAIVYWVKIHRPLRQKFQVKE